ncbi:MAG: hypothetical protein WBO08_16375 [Mycobacterium sp.]
MPEQVMVIPEDLQVSAGTVDAHADNVRAQHFAADSRLEAAQPGVPMGSAAALGAAVTNPLGGRRCPRGLPRHAQSR